MASSSSWDAVELWTSAIFLDENSTSKAKSKVQYYFESEVFYLSTSKEVPQYLESRARAAHDANVPFIVIALVRGSPKWLSSVLSTSFPMLSSGPMQDMLNVDRWESGTAVLPVYTKDTRCISFFMQYPLVDKLTSAVRFLPVATWLRATPGSTSSTIFMACRDEEVPKRLQEQCVSTNWKINKLSAAPGNIFVDLFSFLSEWSDVWRLARRKLSERDAELHDKPRSMGVMQQTRLLHKDAASLIAIREDLRLHVASFQKYKTLTRSFLTRASSFPIAQGADELDSLEDRIEESVQNLLHQQESSAVIHKQLENLLSLAFNTETVSQGLAVARLNFLAFAFLPLSYAATVFGMTNFSISAKWYPLGAVITLLFVAAWFLGNESLSKWNDQRRGRQSSKPQTKPSQVATPAAVGAISPSPAHPVPQPSPANNSPTPSPFKPIDEKPPQKSKSWISSLWPFNRRSPKPPKNKNPMPVLPQPVQQPPPGAYPYPVAVSGPSYAYEAKIAEPLGPSYLSVGPGYASPVPSATISPYPPEYPMPYTMYAPPPPVQEQASGAIPVPMQQPSSSSSADAGPSRAELLQ